MAKCLKCGQEINDTAKFCRYCGQAVEPKSDKPAIEEKTCPQCLKKVPATANFCRYCGSQFTSGDEVVNAADENVRGDRSKFISGNVAVADENVGVDKYKNYITWRVLPEQVAVKIDERNIKGYGRVRGLYLVPGTRAMFFVNGKFVASLESGKYPFKELTKFDEPKSNSVVTFLRNLAVHIKNGIAALFGRRDVDFYSIVLIRETDFKLEFKLGEIATANVRSNIELHILCELTDLNLFYNDFLVDNKFVSKTSFKDQLEPVVNVVLDRMLSSVSPQDIQNNTELSDNVLNALRERFRSIYPYLSVTQIIKLTATHDELDKIRDSKEELYIAEQKLEQMQLREDFLNKIQNADYSNMLRSARSQVDFLALMDKIDEDKLLNEDKKAQFALMLSSERALREARTVADTENALDGLKRSRMLSEDEVESLRRTIAHRADMAEIDDAQAIAMATMQNAEALDREKLQWELEIGNKRFQNQLERDRLRDEYADTRRNADFEFQNRQMASKMDLLRQAVAIREERENAQHQREMESKKLDYDSELEHERIYASMSYEQIMAANPDVSPEAAAVLAKKYEAEALAAQNDRTAELVKQHDEDLKNILAQQMALTRDIITAQNQTNANAVAEKQRELDRVHADSERHQDRMLSGMETTVNAVSQAAKPQVGITFCPNCGRKNSVSAKTCEGCGTLLQE